MALTSRTHEGRLRGAQILITRTSDRAAELIAAIAGMGGEGVACPVTTIAACEGPAIAAATAAIDDYDWVVLSSGNAVGHFFAALGQRRPAAAKWACIGPATAAALAEHGIDECLLPERAYAGDLADAIIAAVGADIGEQRLLFPRACGGRDEGIEALRAAGAQVDTVDLYQSVTRSADDPALQPGLTALRAGRLHACVFFAPSQVRATFDLLAEEAAALLRACPTIATIGTTTASALRDRGVGVDVIPSQPTAVALASAIAERYQGPRGK